jgi:hypothetical protein
MEKDEMGGACGTYGIKDYIITGFWYGSLEERVHLKDPGVNGR